MKIDLRDFIHKMCLNFGSTYQLRNEIFDQSFQQAFTKKFEPMIQKELRSSMTQEAEEEAVELFGENLKQLLLMAPVKGEVILGIDPGFAHGCKLASISECGDVLDTAVIYPHTRSRNNDRDWRKLKNIIQRNE